VAVQERRAAGAVRAPGGSSRQGGRCSARQILAESRSAAVAEGFSVVEKVVAAGASHRAAAAVTGRGGRAKIAFGPRQWVRHAMQDLMRQRGLTTVMVGSNSIIRCCSYGVIRACSCM